MTSPTRAADGAALARLREREEVLQICYWFEGLSAHGLTPKTANSLVPVQSFIKNFTVAREPTSPPNQSEEETAP